MRYLSILFVVAIGCSQQNKEAVINWRDNKAVSITVPDSVKVYSSYLRYEVLGDLRKEADGYLFTPVVPFQRDLTYMAISRTDTFKFTIPRDTDLTIPTVLASYPSCDTVPSNLLKIHLRFSEPMQEDRAAQFVFLFDDVTGDTINGAFLDLKPELWNEDQTVLTLWLDPGRVKKGLIPNKMLGPVLVDNHRYRLEINHGWRSQQGIETSSNYSKTFFTSTPDKTMPRVASWKVEVRDNKIFVATSESLNWLTALQTITLIRNTDERMLSETISEVCERQLIIIPEGQLTPGKYELVVESGLEDNAGNNLNRLFETDVTNKSDQYHTQYLHRLSFVIH